MIPAHEALQLPSAQLTDEEKSAADALEMLIEEHVRKGMGRNGVDLELSMTNTHVIADVNQWLRAAGWNTQWFEIIQQHRLNTAVRELKGYRLSLSPNDESYKAAARAVLS